MLTMNRSRLDMNTPTHTMSDTRHFRCITKRTISQELHHATRWAMLIRADAWKRLQYTDLQHRWRARGGGRALVAADRSRRVPRRAPLRRDPGRPGDRA